MIKFLANSDLKFFQLEPKNILLFYNYVKTNFSGVLTFQSRDKNEKSEYLKIAESCVFCHDFKKF